MVVPKFPFPFLTGFESTSIHGSGKDVLDGTRHVSRWRHDLDLVKASGVATLRYPAPWHRIEKRRGHYDWRWLDTVLGHMRRIGLDPILDPIHHTSFPDWLEGGFAHPQFPDVYQAFVERLAERYPWVQRYTLFNEPFVTTLFCGGEGIWYPRQRGQQSFVRMALQVGRAICRTSASLERRVPGLELVHVDTCEHHTALEDRARERVRFLNHRRFLLHDLILGRIGRTHPLYGYLTGHGAGPAELRWFRDHPARIDVLGLDYYPHSEHQHHRAGTVFHSSAPRGFAAVAGDYAERYGLPVLLAETNIKGLVTDRMSWLRHMLEECGKLAAHTDFRGFCWFPFVDSTDWCSLVRRAEGKVDAVGIYWLDEHRWHRYPSELSQAFGRLARGEMAAADLPAYRFRHPWDLHLAGFEPFFGHWRWREPAAGTAAGPVPGAAARVAGG